MGRRQYKRTHFSVSLVDIEKLYTEISAFFHQAQTPPLQVPLITTLYLHKNIGEIIVKTDSDRKLRDKNSRRTLFQLSKKLFKELMKIASSFVLFLPLSLRWWSTLSGSFRCYTISSFSHLGPLPSTHTCRLLSCQGFT